MKKIIALMLLCLLLCAMSATAMAWKVTFYNYYVDENYSPVEQKKEFTPEGEEFKLPTMEECGFNAPPGQEFFAWKSDDDKCYLAGSTITLDHNMMINPYCVATDQAPIVLSFSPGTGKGNAFIQPVYENIVIPLADPDEYGFKKPSDNKPFKAWLVEGDFIPSKEPTDVGWLFARALAADERTEMAANSWIQVKGAVTITALWGDEDGEQGVDPEPPAPKYNVNVIRSENGSVSVSKTEAKEGEAVTITAVPAEGYGLDGLTVSYSNGSQQVAVSNNKFVMPASDVNVQATFVKRNKVIFNANVGECATASATVNAANKLDELPKATREDYLFIGWFTQAEGGTAITKETVFDQAETTVYAQWYNAKHTTKPDENDFKADIDMEDSDILDLLIDEDDKKDKEDIVVYLTVKEENEADVDSDDKTAIVNKAGEDKIAAYLDIELFKKIGDKEPEKISNTGDMVRIKLKLEDALIPENAVKDSFYIIYYHDGVAKRISASFDVATKELTFEAYEFSTYSLVYKTQTAEDVNVSLPKTGDDSLPMAFLMLMLAASVGGIVLMAKRRTN